MEPRKVKTDYYDIGLRAYKQKNYEKAIKYLAQSFKVEDESTETLIFIGKAYEGLGNANAAEVIYQKCLQLESNNIKGNREDLYSRFCLGKLYSDQGRFEEAEQLLRECLSLDENDLYARTELARVFQRQGKFRKAESIFYESILRHPNDMRLRIRLGQLYEEAGRFAEAEALYKQAQNTKPDVYIGKEELRQFYNRKRNLGIEDKENLRKIVNYLQYEYNEETNGRHIATHFQEDEKKEKHGVFTLPMNELLKIIEWDEVIKIESEDKDIYYMKAQNCGYAGGVYGDREKLNSLIIMTIPNSSTIITMFPSREIETRNMKRLSLDMEDLNVSNSITFKEIKGKNFREDEER